ncbi:hypothetical protein BH10ACT3_BH10ACT3_12460 [soil metagenome]
MTTDLGETDVQDEVVEQPRGLGPLKVLGLVVAVAVVAILATVVVQQRLDTPAHDSVDVGFMQDMIAHHGQAVQLGAIGAQTATDSDVENFALDSVISQQYEVGYMTSLLQDWGYDTGDEDRDAMAWMGAPTSVADMPGMLTPEQIETFRTATGDDANAEFLQLMSEHHRGGLHMAEYTAEHAEDPRVKALADRIVANQKAELAEYKMIAERLGITLT